MYKQDLHALSADITFPTKRGLDTLKRDYESTKRSVIHEDEEVRGLYTLEVSRGQTLKYPEFSGEPGQDFVSFKEKMLSRFRRNKVCKTDQLEKLRECLKGQALRLVPDSVKKVDEAWSTLTNAFGDPSRVLQHRLSQMKQLGQYEDQKNYKQKVELLIQFESIVDDLIKMGEEDEEMGYLAFNQNTINEIVNKFPEEMSLKLLKVGGKGKQRMKNLKLKIVELREDAQTLEKRRPASSSTSKKADKGTPATTVASPDFLVAYREPKRDESCRICGQLETVTTPRPDPRKELYEGHWSNYPTGCPQF